MARFNQLLLGAAGAALLCGCTAGFAQDARVVSAGSADVDADGQDAYRWIDRARALWDAVGDAPPDYSFGFDGGTPVAWELRDGYWVVVEERPEGARTYFFAPGERGPFLVRETDRSFGYQDGNVAAIYDGGGTLLPRAAGMGALDEGEDLYARGRRLRGALLDRQWAPVDTTSWSELNLFFVGIDAGWDSGWRYRNNGFALAEQQRWSQERARRAAMAAAFARWRSGGFQGPPPPGLGNRWQHRPGRPGRPPGAGRPPIAGQPAPPPGGGRPGRPWMWGGLPGQGGDRPDRPHGGTRPTPPQGTPPGSPPPVTTTPGQPPVAGAPGWQGGRPGWQGRPRPDGAPARPPRPDGDGRPGWQGPRPDGVGRPGWQGPRPGSQGGRPGGTPPQPGSPPAAAPNPVPAAPAPAPDAGPRRGGGWMSPGWTRPARPEGGGDAPRPTFRPPAARPEGAAPPNRPAAAPAPVARPAPPPAARPAPAPRPEARPMPQVLREKLEARRADQR